MKKLAVILVAFVLISFFEAIADELDDIQFAIVEQGADWIAQDNPISNLPDDVLTKMMGVRLPPIEFGMYDIGQPSQIVPSEWDWKENGWTTPVRDQGSCGSCWAFGAIAQLESGYMITKGEIDKNLDLSEQYMVSCDKNNFGCDGGYMNRAYNFLLAGVPDEKCFPYKALDLPCNNACANPELIAIRDWYSVPQTIADMQEAVYLQPITCAFYCYRDFTYYTGGIYKHVSGELLGGHAVCIVGWSIRDQCFIVKNSWGKDWGEDGYFRIAFSEMGSQSQVRFGRDAGKFDIPEPSAIDKKTLVVVWGALKASY